jgi:hypothetical protein
MKVFETFVEGGCGVEFKSYVEVINFNAMMKDINLFNWTEMAGVYNFITLKKVVCYFHCFHYYSTEFVSGNSGSRVTSETSGGLLPIV